MNEAAPISAPERLAALDIASQLCSRLCHDLLSPVGALSNGLELLADERDPEMRKRCFELLEQSARASADKLKFFRLAFGAAGGFGEAIPASEPQALIAALLGNGRIELGWNIAPESLPKPAVKVLLNFALIAIEALVRGGRLDIAVEQAGRTCEIAVRAGGPRIAFDATVGRALEGELVPSELSSRTAPAAMLHQLATAIGGTLQYAMTGDALVLGAMLPVG
ncbi:MAG: histidine phosphotransferase [Sphingomonadales bacterium]|nr:histidine phosphotransferase [Sphingomonadales bacterium]